MIKSHIYIYIATSTSKSISISMIFYELLHLYTYIIHHLPSQKFLRNSLIPSVLIQALPAAGRSPLVAPVFQLRLHLLAVRQQSFLS